MTTVELKGKNAVITGASSGIGEGIAIALAKEGCNVALLARSKDKLESVAEKCRSHNVQAHVIETDLSDKNSIDKSVKEVAQVFPTVHILINNAGIGGGSASALDDKVKSDDGEEDVVDMWERVMNVNLVNTMRITNRILQLMKDVEHGAIITTSSLAATFVGSNNAQYHASKWGLNGFLGCLFEDVREKGIKVCSIMPGAVNTPMMDGNTKFNRAKCIQVADIADTVLFVLRMATNACPTEVKVRPQYNAYNK